MRGVGDFANRIQTVFVDLEYKDEANDYAQSRSQALTVASPFFEWVIPVINENSGVVTYMALVAYKDGTSEEVPITELSSNTVILPPPTEAFLEVQVVTELLDWDTVRLTSVSLSYEDLDNNIQDAKTLIFSPTNKDSVTWKVEQKNRQVDDYTYSINYYLADGLQKSVPPTKGRERALILNHQA